MKEMLNEIMEKIPRTNETNFHSSREEYFLHEDEQFFQFCEREATKINTFFAEKLAEALLRFDFLKNELECLDKSVEHRRFSLSNVFQRRSIVINSDDRRNILSNANEEENSKKWKRLNRRKGMKRHRHLKLNDLKLAFSEYYLILIFLKDYQTLNYTGFSKILTKHDRLFETTHGDEWRMLYVDCTPFYTSKRVDQLMEQVEKLYTNVLEGGDRTRAMQRLRVPPLEEKQPRIVTFRLGIFIGMLCVLIPLLFVVGFSLFESNTSKILNWRSGLHLYRSSFLLIIHLIFFGLNVYGWSKSGVNHVLIFEMNPRKHLTYQKFLEIGIFLMVIWVISVILFLITFYYDKYPFLQPILLILFLIIFLINPLPIYSRQSRYWFIKKFFRVITSPFHRVEFCDFWIGDQLCSLELVFFDLEYFLCFYTMGSNISSSTPDERFFCSGWSQICLQLFFQNLPSWFRLVQCLRRYRDTKQKFPHLANAGKYASGFFVSLTNALRRVKSFDYHQHKLENPFFYLWIITSLISSTYKLIWDMKMDCGFFHRNVGENKYLREQLIYSRRSFYYSAIILNTLLRYIWIINIFIHFNSLFAEYSDIIGFSFALIEVFRRFIWNFFRLENEHLTNCGEFRAVRDISIRPTLIVNESLSSTQQTNQTEQRTTNQIPMRRIDHNRRETASPNLRKRTNAEEFFDEMYTVLSLPSNEQILSDHSQNSDL